MDRNDLNRIIRMLSAMSARDNTTMMHTVNKFNFVAKTA